MHFTRYAVYYTPPEGAFSEFGTSWLGWDAARGAEVAHPEVTGLPARVAEITEAPRKYGLHATMKPPFRLAEGQDEAALRDAFARFCAQARPVLLDGLTVTALGRFLALMPEGDTTALDALAAQTVRAFEPFRAPLSAAELARRRAGVLSPDQEARLMEWGYPHVMEGFRFHITLTGKRPNSELPALRDILAAQFLPLLPRPFPIDALSLMGEDAQGRFHLIARHVLTP
ncbi:putative phosphonate metabolism protein [Roseovarius sp. MBR-154]|jgi:putative phosphonate metabolism protein